MSKNLVLLTSAVYSSYGIYTPQERIQQTLETARSAKENIPGAVVVLVDNSRVEVQNDNSPEFNELIDLVDYYIDNSEDPDIKFFHDNVSNYDIGKNSMEVIGLVKAMSHIASDQDLTEELAGCDRIFKLSGRYVVTDKFDFSAFHNENTQGKYVFKRRQPAWCNPQVTGVHNLLQTRLWSFSPDQLTETLQMFQAVLSYMFDVYNKQQYVDVEHCMFKFIPPEKLVELDTVGLKGNIAPNGMMIID